jgi:hypothetical protein
VRRLALLVAFGLLGAGDAFADSHLWDISEVFSNADGSVQFIELLECCGSDVEHSLATKSFYTDANELVFPTNLPDTIPTGGKTFLIGTQSYAALPGVPVPDYVVPDQFFTPAAADTLIYWTYDEYTLPRGMPVDGFSSLYVSDESIGPNTPKNLAGDTGQVVLAASVPGAPRWALVGLALLLTAAVLAAISRYPARR